MKAVLQRVSTASVSVEGEKVASIGTGFLVLLGVEAEDGPGQVERLVGKTVGLRVFPDAAGKMNRSVLEVGGEVLVVSQFTLIGDVRRGRRPSFIGAAPPERARPLVEAFCEGLRDLGVPTRSGVFGAHMVVELRNDGPVTILLDTADLERSRRG
jgi:D-tyrosyl-tRNA(Tyr) deacylase